MQSIAQALQCRQKNLQVSRSHAPYWNHVEHDKEYIQHVVINGYCDADWENDPESRKIVTWFLLLMEGWAAAWTARRQTVVKQSTAEAGYVAACEASMEDEGLLICWMRYYSASFVDDGLWQLYSNYHGMPADAQLQDTPRWIAVALCERSDQERSLTMHKVTGSKPADMFTKALPKTSLYYYQTMTDM